MGSRGSLEGRWGTPGVLGGPWSVGGPGAFWGFQGAPRGPRGISGGRVRVEGPWGVLGAPKESGGAAGQGRRPPIRVRAVRRSPKEPSEERVGRLDSLLGLRHQLHRLSLLPRVVHVASRDRRHNLLYESDAPPAPPAPPAPLAAAGRAACRELQSRPRPGRPLAAAGRGGAACNLSGVVVQAALCGGSERGVHYHTQKAAESAGVGGLEAGVLTLCRALCEGER